MSEEKKKPEEETPEEKKPDTPPEEKPTEPPKDDTKPEGEENKPEKSGEDEKPEEKTEDTPEQDSEKEADAAPPELSEEDKLKEENFRLKTQLEAVKIGFNPDVIEDAVVLAGNIVKKDGSDISAALQAVAKKYPDWKADSKGKDGKSKGGFKVGADTSKQSSANDEKIRQAFGLKNKKD